MNVQYYLAWVCLIHLTVFAIVLFTKKANRKANRMLGIFMLIFAYMHLTHLFLITHTVVQYHFFNELGFLSLFFLGPVYLQYASYLTGYKIAWKKYFILHALPFIPVILFVCSFYFRTQEEIKVYYDGGYIKEPLDMSIVLAIVSIQMGGYMIWSLILVKRYNLWIIRSNRNPLLNLNWLNILTIFMLILSFVIAPALIIIIKSDVTALFVYMPVITLVVYFFLFIKSINFPSTEFDKNIVRAEEREKIGRDMHDDLGSGLSKISFISNSLRKQLEHDSDAVKQIDKISQTSQDLVSNMGHIIWAVNPENDTLDSLIAYIREYAVDFLDDCGLICHVSIPEISQKINLLPEQRKNVFLVIKESLNNITKHAAATQVWIDVFFNEEEQKITIKDDGKGFADNTTFTGNGLKNMQSRMEAIGGKYKIVSHIGKGTYTMLSLPLK